KREVKRPDLHLESAIRGPVPRAPVLCRLGRVKRRRNEVYFFDFFWRRRTAAVPSAPRPNKVKVAGSGMGATCWKLVRASDSKMVLFPLRAFTVPTDERPGCSRGVPTAGLQACGLTLKKQSVGAAFLKGNV